MSYQRRHCTFEFALNNVLRINQTVSFPHFCTSPNIKWVLSFHPYDDMDNTNFTLNLEAKPYTITANECNICYNIYSIVIFIKSLYSHEILKCGAKNVRKVTGNGKGYYFRASRSSLVNNMVVGVNLYSFPIDEAHIDEGLFDPKQISKSLISALSNELNNPDQSDVKFIIQDKSLYARSSILAARSNYFRSMFGGDWKETIDKENQFKYVIEITDFDFKTVFSMLQFFYTDELFIDKDENYFNCLWDLFNISDKYLLDDLKRIVKFHILDRLDTNNAAEILFKQAWKWPDLKIYVINFIVENIKNVRNSKGYKDILINYLSYPNFHELNTEIFLKLYPDESSNIQ